MQLVLDCFPDRQQQLLDELEPHPAQQFAYLKGLVALHQREQQPGANKNGGGGVLASLKVCLVNSMHRACMAWSGTMLWNRGVELCDLLRNTLRHYYAAP